MKALPGSKCQASVTNCEVFAEVGEIHSYNSFLDVAKIQMFKQV